MLRVSLLGEKAITDDNSGVLTSSSRAVALVAFLAAHAGAPQARPRIAGLFWPESADAQALTNLRRELHYLRRVLGREPSLVVTSTDLCWRDTTTCRVDVRVFGMERGQALAAAAAGDDESALQHASNAIAEYQGDFVPGLYDDWLLEARSELERQCTDICDLASAARARAGDLSGAMDAARRRIQLQPLEEVGYRTLMQLQADLGDRAGAVSTYHHCASVLERDLGVSPDPATQQAFQRLMAQADPVSPLRPPAAPAVSRSGLVSAALVGRSAELGILQDLWRAAQAGGPGLVLVRGGAGVGKTRLVTEIAESARQQGAVVASSQCFGSTGRLALTPVADWLRSPAVQAARAGLEESWRAEVARLVPPPGGDAPRGHESPAMPDAWQRHRFVTALARALLAAARPTLLVLDNMQWCDHETLEFITFCLRFAASAPLLIAATLRDDGPCEDPVLGDWTDRMRAAGLLTELSLHPFEAADTGRLAEAISGRPLGEPDAELLHATTGGFPLYVIEAVRGGFGPGSAPLPAGDLAAVLRNRLRQATAPAREVAGLAAAVGTDFTLDLLTEASDLDAGAVVGAIDELWRRRIMREFGGGYDFTHDLLREAAYTLVSPPRRWLLHRRVAQGLELLHAGDTALVSAQLAGQYARGGRPDRAVSYYQRAAGIAAGMFAHAEAIRLHKEALSLISNLPAGRDRDLRELTVRDAMAAPLNARYGYSSPVLQQTLERSVTLAQSLGRSDSTLAGLVALCTSRFVQGRTADSYHIARQALALADPAAAASGPAHFVLGGTALSLGRLTEALHHLELATTLAAGAVSLSVGTRPDVHATAWAAHAHWLLGHDESAQSSRARAIMLARSTDHPYNLAIAHAYSAITQQLQGDLPGLCRSVQELRALCDRHDFAYYREWALILGGWSCPDDSGAERAQRGIGNLKSVGSFARMPYWLSLLADLLTRAGRPAAARATLDAALAAGRAHDDLWWLPEVMRKRAAHDEDQAAISRLRSSAQLASAHGSVALLRRCQHDLAQRGVSHTDPGVPRPAARAGRGER
jgi:DNA-binding SARP family transcriptional activator/tetratricopeptide (TPR) repeat protein